MSSLSDKEVFAVLAQRTDALKKMPADSLRRPWISGFRGTELTKTILVSFEKDDKLIKAELSDSRYQQCVKDKAELPLAAKAFYGADLKRKEEWINKKEERRKKLAPKIRKYDKKFFYWAWGLFHENTKYKKNLEEIRPNIGQRDDAEDTIKLTDLLLNEWDNVENNAPLTKEELKQAQSDANEMLELLADGAQTPDEKKDLWRRAFTLWHNTYMRLFAVGRFIAFDDEDKTVRYPSITHD